MERRPAVEADERIDLEIFSLALSKYECSVDVSNLLRFSFRNLTPLCMIYLSFDEMKFFEISCNSYRIINISVTRYVTYTLLL